VSDYRARRGWWGSGQGVERRSEAFDLEEISQRNGGREAYLTLGLPTCVWGFLGKELGDVPQPWCGCSLKAGRRELWKSRLTLGGSWIPLMSPKVENSRGARGEQRRRYAQRKLKKPNQDGICKRFKVDEVTTATRFSRRSILGKILGWSKSTESICEEENVQQSLSIQICTGIGLDISL
jgi:hypothetical protein